mgnify:FL=1
MATIELEKQLDLPAIGREGWEKGLLVRLLTELAKSNERTGSVYAEMNNTGTAVEFRATERTERFLTKASTYNTIATYNNSVLNRFVGYVNKTLLSSEYGSMGCGILEAHFKGETHPRRFAIFARRSGRLGDFIQIDQFGEHL